MSTPFDRNPFMGTMIRRALDRRSIDTRVSMPARVESYDAGKQLVSVQPVLQEPQLEEDGSTVWDRLPVISNVPVLFASGGGFRETFPVAVGDFVWLIFSDRSLDAWLAQGGEVQVPDNHWHALPDAVAILGMHPNSAPWSGASATEYTVGKDGGPQLAISTSQVKLGGTDATQAVIKGDDFKTALDTMLTAVQAYVAAAALPSPGAAGALTTFNAAKLAFDASFSAALSTTVKTK
jgi:hypothetical protein